MSIEEGRGATSGVLDLKRFRSDAINTKTRLRDEQIQILLKEWPSILWTLAMFIIGAVGVGGFITTLVLRGSHLSPFEGILSSFSWSLGFSCLLSVFIRYTIIGPRCNIFPPQPHFAC